MSFNLFILMCVCVCCIRDGVPYIECEWRVSVSLSYLFYDCVAFLSLTYSRSLYIYLFSSPAADEKDLHVSKEVIELIDKQHGRKVPTMRSLILSIRI